jgi:arsenate reductase-like glutaredoxin family protein
LEASNITIDETVMASKKLQAGDAKILLGDASKLIAMKGKKVVEFDVSGDVSEDAVAAMLGPTGNMRAPVLRTGKTYLVGFNEEVFKTAFS